MQAFYYSRLLLHKQETVPPQRQDGILFTVPATLSWRETVVGGRVDTVSVRGGGGAVSVHASQ